jgi:hypothetical protein
LNTPSVKKLSLVEREEEESLTPKEENELFICKLPEVCDLLDEIEYNQKE